MLNVENFMIIAAVIRTHFVDQYAFLDAHKILGQIFNCLM